MNWGTIIYGVLLIAAFYFGKRQGKKEAERGPF
jgi:hypothetical protein